MRTSIAQGSRTKALWGMGFLAFVSIFVLSQPLWEPGGIDALIAGRDDSRHWWPIAAVGAIVMLPMSLWAALKFARQRGPVIFIQGGDLYAPDWKGPLPLSSIKRVRSHPRWLAPSVHLTLEDGVTKTITVSFYVEDEIAIADRIAEAAGQIDAETSFVPPLS